MQQQEFLIVNKLGLHARASALFVKTAGKFASEVKLARDSVEVNGKSIMGLMMLAASREPSAETVPALVRGSQPSCQAVRLLVPSPLASPVASNSSCSCAGVNATP